MNTIAHYLDAHSHLEEHVGRVCFDLVDRRHSSLASGDIIGPGSPGMH